MRRDPEDLGIQSREDMERDAPALAARPSTVKAVSATGGRAGDIPYGTARCFLDECGLDKLCSKGQISARQWRAGMLFRSRWLAATPRGSYASRYTPRVQGGGGSPGPEPERRLDAQQAVADAQEGMHPDHALAVQAVAGEDESAAGRLSALLGGLDHLADFYGVDPAFSRGRP